MSRAPTREVAARRPRPVREHVRRPVGRGVRRSVARARDLDPHRPAGRAGADQAGGAGASVVLGADCGLVPRAVRGRGEGLPRGSAVRGTPPRGPARGRPGPVRQGPVAEPAPGHLRGPVLPARRARRGRRLRRPDGMARHPDQRRLPPRPRSAWKLAFGGGLSAAGIPTLPRVVLEPDLVLPFAGRYIVKPRFGGSSIGIETVNDLDTARWSRAPRRPAGRRGGEPYRADLVDLNISLRTGRDWVQVSDLEKPLRKPEGAVTSYAERTLRAVRARQACPRPARLLAQVPTRSRRWPPAGRSGSPCSPASPVWYAGLPVRRVPGELVVTRSTRCRARSRGPVGAQGWCRRGAARCAARGVGLPGAERAERLRLRRGAARRRGTRAAPGSVRAAPVGRGGQPARREGPR